MNASLWLKSTPTRVALTALAAAVLVLGWTLVRALRTGDLPPAPPVTIASLETITHKPVRPVTDVQAAVDNNLFSPERTPPAAPYRMPGDGNPNDKPTVEAPKPIVLGTAVATDGRHFATLQLGERPTLVHVGDKIGEWTVKAIERGKVTLVGPNGIRAEVTAPKPGS